MGRALSQGSVLPVGGGSARHQARLAPGGCASTSCRHELKRPSFQSLRRYGWLAMRCPEPRQAGSTPATCRLEQPWASSPGEMAALSISAPGGGPVLQVALSRAVDPRSASRQLLNSEL